MKVKRGFTTRKRNDNDEYDGGFDDNYVQPKKWFEEISPDPKSFAQVTDQILIELKDEAKKCLDSEVVSYNIKNAKTNSDYRWMKTVMSKGTVSDKIAAYTVLIQDNPACNLDTIRNLIGMVKVGKKKECIAVIETLSELFISDLLRPNMKLKPFHSRPLSLITELSSGNAITRRKYLSYWYFEDQLKEAYTTYVLALNAAAHDTVDSNKEKSIAAMSILLAGNPEQEKNLLSHIINKLGDPSQKVASKTMYCLSQLLHKHSNMQGVVLKEIEKLLFRQNIGHRAQYYSICFISQLYLSHNASDVARKLIEVYFSFFKKCIKEGDVDSRMMSALLIGVNRAYPYAKMELDQISEHIDTMYRVVHIANFNVSLHALSLLYQVSEYSDNVNDRFYSALYKKLLDSKLSTTTNQAMLLNLVYKSMMRDTEQHRVKAFIKRLLQVCLHVQPGFACGVLFLVSQIIMKKGVDVFVSKKSTVIDDDEGDDEEIYTDVKDEIENEVTKSQEEDELKADEEQDEIKPDLEVIPASGLKVTGWCHKSKNVRKDTQAFNAFARNPLYAGAEFSALVELNELKNHFHPSVALFAEKILYSEPITYTGDPLKDFTLIRFLDRFVFKNPKKTEDLSKGSHLSFRKRKFYKPSGIRALSVTSSNYLNEKEKNIPVEELFMYNYLQKKYGNKEEKEEDNSDNESVASEEFEEMLNKMSGFKDIDDDIDYMNEIGESLKKSSKAKKSSGNVGEDSESGSGDEGSEADSGDEELSGEEDDMDEIGEAADIDELGDDDFDDHEMNDDDKDMLKDLDDDDDDESDIVFDSDEDDDTSSKKSKKKKRGAISSIFASAEEFASILEDEGSSKVAPGSTNQFSNKDKAGVKQLDWEDKRNKWLTGFKKAVGGKGDKFGNKEKSFKNKRSSKSNFSPKIKKQKRF